MNIGDKVRLLRAKEQGVISRFLPGDMIEIEIEDGFLIPVMRSELVSVSPLEAERLLRSNNFAAQKTAAPAAPAILSNQGVYLAFMPINDREYSLHLINNTDWELPYALGEESASPGGGIQFRGLHSGLLKAKAQQKMNDVYTHANIDTWPTFVLQALWFRAGKSSLRPPLVKRFKARSASLFTEKSTVPVLNQSGFMTQLDAETPASDAKQPPTPAPAQFPLNISADELKAAMFRSRSEDAGVRVERPSSVIDLHVDELLAKNPGALSPKNRTTADLLTFQLDTFERALENAIANGMSDITFIHGVGSGALRTELHRRLGKNPSVKFFEDAQKQKFGYGATKVTIK